jgi:transcription antitermination factor NusG
MPNVPIFGARPFFPQTRGATCGSHGEAMPISQYAAPDHDPAPPFSGRSIAWYALQTRYQCEKRVDAALREQGFETFIPMQRAQRRWSDRTKIVETPIFSGYGFVRMEPNSQSISRVLCLPGFVRFVTAGRDLAVVSDGEIEGIRTVLQTDALFEEGPYPAIGERVRVRGGLLEGIEGILMSRSGRGEIVISVGAIQKSLKLPLASYDVERIPI